MITPEESAHDNTIILGFWAYLMTDLVLFASLFATFAVLRSTSIESSSVLFDPGFALTETLILLGSSFACGLAMLAARAGKRQGVLGWLLATFALGALFLVLEGSEFMRLVAGGNGLQKDGFLSSYFALVGTHGLHIAVGLLWMLIVMMRIEKRGLTRSNLRKLFLLSLFWHFLDLVWIFIFTIVYLLGII